VKRLFLRRLPVHDGVRSSLVVPIAYQEQIAGLIHLHSITPNRFDYRQLVTSPRHWQSRQLLPSAAPTAFRNRSAGVRCSTDIRNLARLLKHLTLQADQTLEAALENIASAIQGALLTNTVLISVYDLENDCLRRIAGVGIPDDAAAELWTRTQPYSSLQQVLSPEFRIGRSYFIPNERMPVLPGASMRSPYYPWHY
jgi:GAF domain-containing protein